MEITRVLVVDDHALVREMLADRIRHEEGLAVLGTASGGDEAILKVSVECPDVLVMDIDMEGLDCFETVRRIKAHCPEVGVVFLSAYTNDHYIDQALAVGARAYVVKSSPPETVIAAIREVAADGAYFSEEVQARIVAGTDGARLTPSAKSRAATLTDREIEVLRYIASGLSKKRIAELMGLSVNTVDRHTSNIMNKLAVHDRVGLTKFAIREGFVEP